MTSRAGILNKNSDNNKYVIFIGEFEHIVLSSGTVVEIFNENKNIWIKTRIEHNGSEYYSTNPLIELTIGQKVRLV